MTTVTQREGFLSIHVFFYSDFFSLSYLSGYHSNFFPGTRGYEVLFSLFMIFFSV